MRAKFFLPVMEAQWNEGGRRILLGDNTGNEAVLPRPIKYHYVGVRISAGLPHTRAYIWPHTHSVPNLCKFQLGRIFQDTTTAQVRYVNHATEFQDKAVYSRLIKLPYEWALKTDGSFSLSTYLQRCHSPSVFSTPAVRFKPTNNISVNRASKCLLTCLKIIQLTQICMHGPKWHASHSLIGAAI
jgi:hypothetical protein